MWTQVKAALAMLASVMRVLLRSGAEERSEVVGDVVAVIAEAISKFLELAEEAPD